MNLIGLFAEILGGKGDCKGVDLPRHRTAIHLGLLDRAKGKQEIERQEIEQTRWHATLGHVMHDRRSQLDILKYLDRVCSRKFSNS